MPIMFRSLRRTLMVAAAFVAVGCTSTSPVKYSGLPSSARMSPVTSDDRDRIPFRYAVPVSWSKYRSITLEPVKIYGGNNAQFNELSQDDRRRLAEYMGKKFGEALGRQFTVNSPVGNAPSLRLKLTLTGADTTPQVIGTFTKFDLAGGPYNIVQSIRGGRGLMSGYVNYAVEVEDAKTNELLLAYVAEQYPDAMNVGATFGALSAAETGVDKGAEQLVEMLR